MLIRPVELRDVDAWAVMRARLWPQAAHSDLARETQAFVAGERESMIAAVFIAVAEPEAPLGFVEIGERAFADGCASMPIPHIEGWYVEPSARGRGVGRELLCAAEEWARGRGYTEIASDTELDNTSSMRAHEACGYAEVERSVKYRKVLNG